MQCVNSGTLPELQKGRMYAYKVTYQTDSFWGKNRDYIVAEHYNLLSSSRCPFVSGFFTSLPDEVSRLTYKFSSVASRFKALLHASVKCHRKLVVDWVASTDLEESTAKEAPDAYGAV